MAGLEHPSDEQLQSCFDRDLGADQTERILDHLDACRACSLRLEKLEPALLHYRQFRALVEPRLPRPARPWADLTHELERRTGGTAPVALKRPLTVRWRPFFAAAFAAGLLIGALLMWPRQKSSDLETILARASAVRPAAGSRLRVETAQGVFIRPAILFGTGVRAGGSDSLRARFVAARYDWDNPLSAAAYQRWRSQLANRRDYVEAAPERTTVRTTTSDGPLEEASLTLRAPDLAPESGKFQFQDQERVEISVLPESTSGAVSAPSAPQPAAPALPQSPEPPLIERELHVRLAIDRLSAEAGLPVTVEVLADGRIVVTPYGLPPELGRQLEASLTGISNVTLRDPARGGAAVAQSAPPAPFSADDQTVDRAIGLSESISANAHILAELAERFPAAAETQLKTEDRAALWDMRARHAVRLNADVDALLRRLMEDGIGLPANGAVSQPGAEALLAAAGQVDTLVTALYTNSRATNQIPALNRDLGEQMRALQQLSRDYARSIEEARANTR